MNANLIVVGGPISVGKSTLVSSLDFPQVPELNDNDKLQELMLEGTYAKNRVSPEVIEFYFLIQRIKKYKNFSNTLTTHVLDRSIFESLWFAKASMSESSFAKFEKLWELEVLDLIKEYGKPKLYILLTMNWETFEERIFLRGREVEVKNFQENKGFFKQHVEDYEKHMISIFEKFDLKYKKIETDKLNPEIILEIANESIKGVEHE